MVCEKSESYTCSKPVVTVFGGFVGTILGLICVFSPCHFNKSDPVFGRINFPVRMTLSQANCSMMELTIDSFS